MTCASITTTHFVPTVSIRRLPRSAAFYLLASMTSTFLAGSSAPTPLYPLYQSAWGLSPTTVTFVFAIYALPLLGALLVAGRLSDHVGRRPVLIVAALAQAVAMVVFATAHGLSALLVARVIQGLATGVALAAIGAAVLDLDKTRGAVANAVAPALGTASGAMVAGLMVHFLPAPTELVYVVLAVIFVLLGIGVLFMAETISLRRGAMASLVPQFHVPATTRKALFVAAPVLVATWALAGFYASLGPRLIGQIFGLDTALLGGLALFVLAGSGALSILFLRRREPQVMMSLGASALLGGVAVVITALGFHSAALFFLGTAVAGIGFGTGFQGAMRSVVSLAAPHERAGVLSVIFVVSYVAMGVPAMFAGYLVALTGNILAIAQGYGAFVIVLAALAMVGTLSMTGRRAAGLAGGHA